MVRTLMGALGDDWRQRAWFSVCAVLALFAIWGHRYPVGIDLPQHANLFRLWTELNNGPLEYKSLYRVELFTPYLVPYLAAYPLTSLFGALAAVKLLYSVVAVGTPLLMRKWLEIVGGAPGYALVAFVAAFGFPYIWGFFSNVVAIPLVFAYLVAFESQQDRPKLSQVLLTVACGVALFLSHGITFGLAASAAGVSFVLRGGWLRRWRVLLHLLPLVAVACAWLMVRHRQTSSHPIQDYVNWDRIISLFSGGFLPYPDVPYAKLGALGVALFLLVTRPSPRLGAARLAPLLVALVGFLALPDWIASTWLVGTRLCVFVHLFAPAVLEPRERDVVARQWPHVLGALVVAFLVLLNVRLGHYNEELRGMDEVARGIPPGADLQTLVPETDWNSESFGAGQLGQVPAWITAAQGGMIDNDSGTALYYQIPIKRNDVPFPSRFRFAIAHGDEGRYASRLRHLTGVSKPKARAGSWLLYERPHVETDAYEVVRDAQGWGQLRQDRSITGAPLRIADTKFETGLGAHAESFIRLRFKRAASRLSGKCGVDAAAGSSGQVVFRVRDDSGRVLFQSPLLQGGQDAQAFSVAVGGRSEILLEALAPHGVASAHADWVDLRVD